MAVEPTFSGEVQFAGFADGSRGGPRVTLRLSDRSELERFIGCEGKRYMAVLVEIGDDEKPVQPHAQKAAAPTRERMHPLCEWAVMSCKDETFKRWAFERAQQLFGPAGIADYSKKYGANFGEGLARGVVLHLCQVESRKELDVDHDAGRRLHTTVRQPFIQWQQAREKAARQADAVNA